MGLSASMEVGHVLIAIISLLFFVGAGSIIVSIIYDFQKPDFLPVAKSDKPLTSMTEIEDYYDSIAELTLTEVTDYD